MPHALGAAARTLTHETAVASAGSAPGRASTWARLRIGGSIDRPLLSTDVEVNAEARQGREDVGEKDHPIRAQKPETVASRSRRRDRRFQKTLAEAGVAITQLAIHLQL